MFIVQQQFPNIYFQNMKKIIQDYTLLEKIGAGSYGDVFKAKHKSNPQLFAVKIIPIEKFQKLQKLEECVNNQIKVLSMIGSSPHIIKYYEKIVSKNNYYFVYEFCNEGTLKQYIEKNKKLQEKCALKIFSQLQAAFKVLNSYNIMHRDLKPQNIFLHNGQVKIGDFGFCKDLQSDQSLAKTMLGSPIYMAPEVLKGHMYTSKTDIWSLGIILYQMLYGFCPYNSKNIFNLVTDIEHKQLNFPEGTNVSEKTKNLIKKLIMRQSYKRMSWSQLFKIEINQQGQYIQQKQNWSTQSKSNSISPGPLYHKKSLDFEISDTQPSNSLNESKKSSSLTKPQKQKVFYSQNFIELLSSKNITIDGINTRNSKKDENKERQLQKADYFKEVQKKMITKEERKYGQKQNTERDKRKSMIQTHEFIVRQMNKALTALQQNGMSTIQEVYLKLIGLQTKLKTISQSINVTELQLLDMSSIVGYEGIQLDKFVKQLREYMYKSKIQIPNP